MTAKQEFDPAGKGAHFLCILISIYPSLWIAERVFLSIIYSPRVVIAKGLHFDALKPSLLVSNGDELAWFHGIAFLFVYAVFLFGDAYLLFRVYQKWGWSKPRNDS